MCVESLFVRDLFGALRLLYMSLCVIFLRGFVYIFEVHECCECEYVSLAYAVWAWLTSSTFLTGSLLSFYIYNDKLQWVLIFAFYLVGG